MSQDSERLKAFVNFKKKLEKQIEELSSELEEYQALLEAVNSVLLEKGFKRGDMKEVKLSEDEAPPTLHVIVEKEVPVAPQATESESVIPLKTMDDLPLAIIYVDKGALHVLPDETKKFDINTPPFQPFLVERVLAKMQEKDSELVRTGQLAADKMFAFNIMREGDLIREIVIKNFDDDRLKELKSSIRWTLEKMYEKTKADA
jgi:hypothetical protein